MGKEWYYISSTGQKDEQKRDVSGDREVDLVFSDDDRFTVLDVVPTVNVHELEKDDSDDKDDVGVYP
tara:strand:- start:553 stop:753 length:201 start_codon:yes stop_codon:yes gene_type:complete